MACSSCSCHVAAASVNVSAQSHLFLNTYAILAARLLIRACCVEHSFGASATSAYTDKEQAQEYIRNMFSFQ
jgi:hypothetical protein